LALDALQTHGHAFNAVVKMLRENDEDAYRSSLFPIPCPILILSQFLILDWLRNQRPDLKASLRCIALSPSSLFILLTNAELPTAIASGHQSSRPGSSRVSASLYPFRGVLAEKLPLPQSHQCA
jgi:hypothetical protein